MAARVGARTLAPARMRAAIGRRLRYRVMPGENARGVPRTQTMVSQRFSVSAVREGMRLATGRAGCRCVGRVTSAWLRKGGDSGILRRHERLQGERESTGL